MNITLGAQDLVLLDFSANDALHLKKEEEKKVIYSVNNLVKQLLLKVTGNWPTFVLLETYVYGINEASYSSIKERPIPLDDGHFKGADYANAYRDIAKLYKFPVWSFR